MINRAHTHRPSSDDIEMTEEESRKSWLHSIGSYLPIMLMIGLAVPIVIYILIMVMLGWRTPVLGSNAAVTYAAGSSKVYLYASRTTASYVARVGGNYDVLLNPWRAYFKAREHDFKEIQDLTKLRRESGSVLVLPSTLLLDDAERAEIQAFRTDGGAVLATWATGTRNLSGDWQGWQFLEQLGARVTGELPTDSDERQLVLMGESPISHAHPAGQRIWMSKTTEPLLRLKGEMVGGKFMDWARVIDEDRRGDGAIVYAEGLAAAGRSAVFAFAESTWESHPLTMHTLIDDTLRWLRREPTVIRAAWPHGKRAANVIEMDTEEGFANASSFASMLRAQNLPATFFVLTSVASRFPDILSELARDFDVGYHGDIHDGFKGQAAPVQERRIAAMRSDILNAMPKFAGTMSGFRAPKENYDATTELLLQKAGIRHHAADPNRSEGRLPFLVKMEGVAAEHSLIVLPRTQRDDLNLIGQNLTAEQMLKALIDDFHLTVETGSLGWLSIHSQNFSADSALARIIPAYLEEIKQRSATTWLASASQVANWWRERERFKLSAINTGKRIEVNITITGETPVEGASMVVLLPFRNAVPQLRTTKVGESRIPRISRIDNYRSAIVFDALQPGNYAYQLTFSDK